MHRAIKLCMYVYTYIATYVITCILIRSCCNDVTVIVHVLFRFDGKSGDFEYKYNPCYPMNVDGYPGCSDSTAAVSR